MPTPPDAAPALPPAPGPADALPDTLPDAPAEALRQGLIRLVLPFMPAAGAHTTAIPGLTLIRADTPGQRLPAVYEPGLVLVLQGRKQVTLGHDLLHYDPLHALLVSVTMLPLGQVLQASAGQPYLCVRLSLDAAELAALVLQAGPAVPTPAGAPGRADRGVNLTRVGAPLLDAVGRLLRLLHTPQDVPVLAPLVLREVFYRVLTGALGPRLRALAVADSQAQRIARAIELLKQHLGEPLRIDALAAAVHMSPSSLHLHFKQVTAMSPLQYHKQLRLHQARRLMLADGLDAATAAHRVGYESPSQFSREYRRLFGAPPRTDVDQVRAAALDDPPAGG